MINETINSSNYVPFYFNQTQISRYIEMPFYKWFICLGNNCLRVWVIGLLVLIFIILGVVMYKLGKKKYKK